MYNWIEEGWNTVNEFVPVTDTVTKVGKWMEDNPGGAQFVGGAAKAGMDYYSQQQKNEQDMRRQRDERAWRENRSKASSGGNGYGSHNYSLTKGLLAG